MKKVYMHYCQKDGCYPRLFYDFSSEPVPCPDCGTLSRRATFEEECHRRDVLDHPSSMMEMAFLMDGATPQHSNESNGYGTL